jgi:hypothetical protein
MALGKEIELIKHLKWWQETEVNEYEVALLASFENFMYVCFMQRFKVPPTRVQMDIARWMADGPVDRGVMAFRNAAKTTIASCYCVWWTYRDPRITIRVMSGEDKLAKEIAAECRIWYETVDIVESLHPAYNLGSPLMLDNARSFNVFGALGGKTATFTASPISGNVTGGRAHIILQDDIENPNNCGTAAKRESLRLRDAEVHNLLHDSKSTNFIEGFQPFLMYLGTPHTEESIYYYKMNAGYAFRIWPARYPNARFMETIGGLISPMLLDDLKADSDLGNGYGPGLDEGRVTELERFTEEHFDKKRATEGAAGFAKQFMLDVSLQNIDKFPLKVRDIIVEDLDHVRAHASYMAKSSPETEIRDLQCVGMPGDVFYRPSWRAEDVYPYDEIVMAIDPSGQGADETTYAIVAALNGNFFVLDFGGMAGYGKGYSDDVLFALAEKAKEYAVNDIFIESNFGDGMMSDLFAPVLKKVYNCKVTDERAFGQKELRIIDTLEPVLNRRRLIFSKKAIENDYANVPLKAPENEQPTYRLIFQLARITRDKNSLAHDDRLDSLELAVRKLIRNMALDQQEQSDRKMLASAKKGILRGGSITGRSGSKQRSKNFFKRR